MKFLIIPLLFLSQLLVAQKTVSSSNKNEVLLSVEKHQQELIKLSDQIWGLTNFLNQTKKTEFIKTGK